MSNIFSGTEVPQWLQNIARPADTDVAAKVIGTGLGGLFNAARDAKYTQDRADAQEAVGQPAQETKTWLQEIPQGLAEARLNLMDPLWKVKLAQQGAQIKQHQAAAQVALQHADLMAHNAQNETDDAPIFSDWVKSIAADPTTPPPVGLKSQKYNQMVDQTMLKVQQQAIERQRNQNTMDTAAIKADLEKQKIDATKAQRDRAKAPPEIKELKLPDGSKVNVIFEEATGRWREVKTGDEMAKAETRKRSNLIQSKIIGANATLAKAKANPKDKQAIKDAQAYVDDLRNQLKDLMDVQLGTGTTNDPSRFKITPVPTAP